MRARRRNPRFPNKNAPRRPAERQDDAAPLYTTLGRVFRMRPAFFRASALPGRAGEEKTDGDQGVCLWCASFMAYIRSSISFMKVSTFPVSKKLDP